MDGQAKPQRQATSLRDLLGLPEGPAWLWLFFVAPAVQVIAHADKTLHLSDWILHALARWREVSHRLWTDLFGWLHIQLPLDIYELDGLTLAVLCGAAAFGSLVRGARASLQSDVMAAYDMAPASRLALFSTIAVVAISYFWAFIGLNGIHLYGDYRTPVADFNVRTLLIASSVLGAILLVAGLSLGRRVFLVIRVEIVLAIVMFIVGWMIILAMSQIIGFAAAEEYLHVRGLGWGAYGVIIFAMSCAIALVLAVNWRALPAIMLIAVIVTVGDRLVQLLTPLADYLRSL